MLCRISLEITHEFTPRINLKNFWPSQWSTPGIFIRLSLMVSLSFFLWKKKLSPVSSLRWLTVLRGVRHGVSKEKADAVFLVLCLTRWRIPSRNSWKNTSDRSFFNTRGTLGPDPRYQWSKQFSNIKIFNEISKFYNRTCIKHSFTSNWLACCSCIIFVLTIQRSEIIDSVEEIHEVKWLASILGDKHGPNFIWEIILSLTLFSFQHL